MIKNDTVIGDPLFEAALWVGESTCEYSLCYEIHGESGQHFNLVSDMCVSVNAHYTPMRNPSDGNIISAIGMYIQPVCVYTCIYTCNDVHVKWVLYVYVYIWLYHRYSKNMHSFNYYNEKYPINIKKDCYYILHTSDSLF